MFATEYASARLHSFGFDDRDRGWRGQVFDKRLCGYFVFGIGPHTASQDNVGLQLGWKRADDFHARHRRQFRNELNRHISLTLCHEFGRRARRDCLAFRFHLLGDAQLLRNSDELQSAQPCRCVCYRLRIQ